MPSSKPWKLHDRERPGHIPWKDARTDTILAPGAVQNWPTTMEIYSIAKETAIANEMARQRHLEEKAARERERDAAAWRRG